MRQEVEALGLSLPDFHGGALVCDAANLPHLRAKAVSVKSHTTLLVFSPVFCVAATVTDVFGM